MAGLDWRPTPEPVLLWINTGILVISSLIFQRARGALRAGNRMAVERATFGAGIFAVAFLAGQLIAWRELLDAGFYATNNPANAFFYLITTLHGLHMLGGLVAWGRAMSRLRQGVELPNLRVTVELCAVYWHFLLIVWLAFFYLLLVT
jgi:cytochrome c oxidase subunit 3